MACIGSVVLSCFSQFCFVDRCGALALCSFGPGNVAARLPMAGSSVLSSAPPGSASALQWRRSPTGPVCSLSRPPIPALAKPGGYSGGEALGWAAVASECNGRSSMHADAHACLIVGAQGAFSGEGWRGVRGRRNPFFKLGRLTRAHAPFSRSMSLPDGEWRMEEGLTAPQAPSSPLTSARALWHLGTPVREGRGWWVYFFFFFPTPSHSAKDWGRPEVSPPGVQFFPGDAAGQPDFPLDSFFKYI